MAFWIVGLCYRFYVGGAGAGAGFDRTGGTGRSCTFGARRARGAEDRQILCGISFGYSDTAHPANSFRTTRAAVDEVMDWR